MKAERLARLLVILLVLGLPAAVVATRSASGSSIDLHARMADDGGWTPGVITAQVGEPIVLRLTSDDVTHGFAVGQSDLPSVEVLPGKWTTTTLVFDQPGKYTFYCTRWCGPNHWRMRGTIEVTGAEMAPITSTPPLYVALQLDLDAPHLSDVVPAEKPSAARGATLNILPDIAAEAERTQSPAQAWHALRDQASAQALTDQQVWDLVALAWRSTTSPAELVEGRKLYAANCAACHGETGRGDGVMAASLQTSAPSELPGTPAPHAGAGVSGHDTVKPADFANAQTMLGASSAVFQGKIVRGGMGTGMPYWGPIFTESQIRALVAYLWTFQFSVSVDVPIFRSITGGRNLTTKPSKKIRHKSQPNLPIWLPLIIVAGVALIVVALVSGNNAAPAAPAAIEVKGTPALKVDRDKVDFGDVKLGKTVQVSFEVTNVGDQPLSFKEKPYVEVAEGC